LDFIVRIYGDARSSECQINISYLCMGVIGPYRELYKPRQTPGRFKFSTAVCLRIKSYGM